MTEYIPKQRIIDEIEEWEGMYPDSQAAREALSMLKHSAKKIPAADVRPVVRGRWIPDEIAAYDRDQVKKGWVPWLCSECGWCVGKHQTAFCPSCGADMREEET